MQIRPYQPSDLRRLHEITTATFGPVSIDANIDKLLGTTGWQDRKLASIAKDCEHPDAAVFVAVDDTDSIVAYITTRIERESKVGLIPNLATDPAHQNKGLARALLEHAIAFFKSNGLEIARIETLDQNPVGQHLYPQLGFKEVARQIHFAMRLRNES